MSVEPRTFSKGSRPTILLAYKVYEKSTHSLARFWVQRTHCRRCFSFAKADRIMTVAVMSDDAGEIHSSIQCAPFHLAHTVWIPITLKYTMCIIPSRSHSMDSHYTQVYNVHHSISLTLHGLLFRWVVLVLPLKPCFVHLHVFDSYS